MNPTPDVEVRPKVAVLISIAVVINVIWWMVMIAAIGLGATRLYHCPVQPYIPIYLMVLGVANLLSLSLTYARTNREGCMVYSLCTLCMAILHLFTFGWFIAGTFWVYSVHGPDYTPGAFGYCDKIIYQFAFTVTTLVWVLFTLVFVCGGCFVLLTCCNVVVAQPSFFKYNNFYGATIDSYEPTAGDV